MNPLFSFWLYFKASLFSTGGTGNLPSLHTDLIARHRATDRQFVESLAIGQVAPGPSGLWVISLGYLTDGLRGALIALIAITLPPLLVIAVDRIYARIRSHPAVEGFVRGLSLAVIGIFAVILSRMLQVSGLNGRSLAIALAALGLGTVRRAPVPAILGIAAVAGWLLFRS